MTLYDHYDHIATVSTVSTESEAGCARSHAEPRGDGTQAAGAGR